MNDFIYRLIHIFVLKVKRLKRPDLGNFQVVDQIQGLMDCNSILFQNFRRAPVLAPVNDDDGLGLFDRFPVHADPFFEIDREHAVTDAFQDRTAGAGECIRAYLRPLIERGVKNVLILAQIPSRSNMGSAVDRKVTDRQSCLPDIHHLVNQSQFRGTL
ncbi:MAG: hypothetical protein R6V25_04480 [Desulfatiglandales bacterium]